MSKILYITIDTEADADIHWKKNFPLGFSSITEGIERYLRPLWNKYNICPIYFVSFEVLESDLCCEVLRREILQGAVIGAHLHPEQFVDYEKKVQYPFPCNDLTYDEEKIGIVKLTQKIREKLEVNPVWYRAARFGADLGTIKILQECGYKYDSSITPNIDWSSKGGPNHSRLDLYSSYLISSTNYYESINENRMGIEEYPITILGKRWSMLGKILPDNWLFFRWFRPTHMFLYELKSIIQQRAKESRELVMMFHSMEIMINKSPYVRNRVMQRYYLWRLEKAIKFAKEMSYISYSLE